MGRPCHCQKKKNSYNDIEHIKPDTPATSSPIAVAYNQLLKLPNTSTRHPEEIRLLLVWMCVRVCVRERENERGRGRRFGEEP